MRRHAFEAEGGLNIGQRAEVEHAAKTFGMPGHRRVDIVEQAFAHHKGFAGAAFFAGTAVEAQCAALAVFRPPGFDGESGGQTGGAEQIVSAAVAVAVFHQRLWRGAPRSLA